MAIYGYCRVSSHEQVDNNSLAEQAKTVTALAELAHKAAPTQVFVEEGVSGSIPLAERPEGEKLLAALKPGDVVIVTKLDRAFRSAVDALQQAEEWKKAGIKFVIAQLGQDPVNNGNGLAVFFFGIMAQVAQLERTLIAERMAEGRAAKRAKGGYGGGIKPFGFMIDGTGRDAKLIPDPEEQAIIRHIRVCHENGLSLRKAAERIEVKFGRKVHTSVINKVYKETENGGKAT